MGGADGAPDQQLLAQVAAPDPRRTPAGGRSADRHGYLDQVIDQPERTVLLRAFCIDERHPGRGYGTGAARRARALGGRVAPSADLVVLTVNTANTAARAVYARAGFADTGARYTGSSGEQWVMAATAVRGLSSSADQPRASAGST